MAVSRRQFTENFKQEVVRQVIAGAISFNDQIKKHGLSSSVFYRWKELYGVKVAKEHKAAVKATKSGGANLPVVVGATLEQVSEPPPTDRDERRARVEAAIKAGGKPRNIAREFGISAAMVQYYKKRLKQKGALVVKGEVVADVPRGLSLPTGLNLRDCLTVANSIERDIMNEYVSGNAKELSAKDLKTLTLRKMLKGEM